jgi:hypothetical protein|tara:strand:- start:1580 stop:1831 length:252 start_codon:yes stop_codon:yes gene_type:complete
MQQQQPAGPPIDLKNTTEVKNFDGGVLFNQGVILRTVSKFVMGTEEDALLPIPVFYDPSSQKILKASVPKDLREELKDYIMDN